MKFLHAAILFISCLLIVAGLGFIVIYLWEGIIVRIGNPDQSLVFWYLPILYIGVFSLTSGVALFVSSYKKLKS